MLSPSKAMFETIAEFMKTAKEVQIDSVHAYKVGSGMIGADGRMHRLRSRGSRAGGQGARSWWRSASRRARDYDWVMAL